MRPLNKTDLRRGRSALQPEPSIPRTATGAAEETLLFGESPRAIPPLNPATAQSLGRSEAAEDGAKN